MKIDLVYLWCDGSDPLWRTKRESYMPEEKRTDSQTFCKGRIIDNDELRYSLRSVEMYAPWINHIYIITDNQTPSWLDTTNSKITIVNQNDIIPPETAPTFNSCAIELCISSIAELSEYYLYANDDMMFARKVTPGFFFTNSGKLKSRFCQSPWTSAEQVKESTYDYTIMRVNETISSDYNAPQMIGWLPHHNIDACKKSSANTCLEKYKSWTETTLRNRFRTPMDMQRHMFSMYAVADNDAEAIFPEIGSKSSRVLELVNRALISLNLKKGYDSICFQLNHSDRIIHELKKYRPYLVCFNDNENTTDEDRLKVKKIFAQLFPNKSQFEL